MAVVVVVVVLLTPINETRISLADYHFIDRLTPIENQFRATTVQSTNEQLFKQITRVETRVIKDINFSFTVDILIKYYF